MNSKVLDRLSQVRDEENDVEASRKWALKTTRGTTERGLRQRMADRAVVSELRKELKKREEANA